jgi:hypothetical protein
MRRCVETSVVLRASLPLGLMIGLMLAVVGLVYPAAAQQEVTEQGRSAIVEIKDVEQRWDELSVRQREKFAEVAAPTPAWERAREAAKASAENPEDVGLKQQLIDARADVLLESIIKLNEAIEGFPQFEQAYREFRQQLDAELTQALSEIKAGHREEVPEIEFLEESIAKLRQLDQLMTTLNGEMLNSSDPAMLQKMQRQDQMLLTQFQAERQTSKLKLQLAAQGDEIKTQHLLALSASQERLEDEFFALKNATLQAASDKAVFQAVASNDLKYTEYLRTAARLERLSKLTPIDRSKALDPELLGGGQYFFPAIVSGQRLRDLVEINGQEIDESERMIEARRQAHRRSDEEFGNKKGGQ